MKAVKIIIVIVLLGAAGYIAWINVQKFRHPHLGPPSTSVKPPPKTPPPDAM